MEEKTKTSIKVRYPQEDDIKALAAFNADVREETSRFEKRHQLLYKEIQLSKAPNKFFLIIEYNNEIGGFIRAVRSSNTFSRIWWIAGLEIKPSLRRQKLGSYLIKETIYNLYHRGCSRVFLEVDNDNKPGIAFYNKMNFVKAKGLTASIVGLFHRDKVVLMLNLEENKDWINRPSKGYKYMGIK